MQGGGVGRGFFCSQDSVLFLPAYRPHPKSRLEPLKEARSCISRISYSIPVRFSKPYGEGFTDTDTDTHSASLLAPNLYTHTHTHTHTRPPNLYIPPQRNRPAPGADLELSLLLIFLPAILIPAYASSKPSVSHDVLCIEIK